MRKALEKIIAKSEILQDFRDEWESNPKCLLSKIAGISVAITVPVIVTGIGAIRGYNGESIFPESPQSLTTKDYIEGGIVAAYMGLILADTIKDQYSQGSEFAALSLPLAPAYFMLIHSIGYAGGIAARRFL